MKAIRRKYPVREANRQEIVRGKVVAGALRSVDWHQQIKRQGNGWPGRAVRLPMGEAAAATAAGRNQTEKHTFAGVFFFIEKPPTV